MTRRSVVYVSLSDSSRGVFIKSTRNGKLIIGVGVRMGSILENTPLKRKQKNGLGTYHGETCPLDFVEHSGSSKETAHQWSTVPLLHFTLP